jgi:hypothetical protein
MLAPTVVGATVMGMKESGARGQGQAQQVVLVKLICAWQGLRTEHGRATSNLALAQHQPTI